jgi:predicted CopG family antitoxin
MYGMLMGRYHGINVGKMEQAVTRTITIPDETYERLEQVAASQHEAVEDLLLRMIASLFRQKSSIPLDNADEQMAEVLRGPGLDEELVAHVLAAPTEKRPQELRLALTALADEQLGPPRQQTFEEFFHDLGMTNEQIAEAKRRAAHADL